MADLGHELTEARLKRLEKEIAAEYKTAVKDAERKLETYLRETEKQRQVQEKLYRAGKISSKEYKDWCFRHEMMGKRWEEMKEVLAQDFHHANEIALGITKGAMPDIYALNANYATYQIEHDGRIDTGFTLYNHDTANYLLGDQRQLMPKPSAKKAAEIAANKDLQWNMRKIQSSVLQGVLQGESPYEVANRLQAVGQMNYNSAVRYARTMTTSAQNAGRYEAYRRADALGVELTIEWQATLDHRTRHDHRQMHGQRTEVDEPFHTPDGFTIYYPADCTGASTAPQHEIWNCRCTLLSWVKGFEGDAVTHSDEMGDMTYDEWLEEKAPKPTQTSEHEVVQGKDISRTWTRRADQYAYQIEDIINAQGFDGLPQVVSEDEFEKLAADSPFVAQRTYSAKDQETLNKYREQLYGGEWYVDCSKGGSALGRGMYTAAVDDASDLERLASEMQLYRRGRTDFFTETMCFTSDFKTVNYEVLNNEMEFFKVIAPDLARANPKFAESFKQLGAGEGVFGMLANAEEMYSASDVKELTEIVKQTSKGMACEDYGARAAKFGFDGIVGKNAGGAGVDYLVVLNRTKIIFLEP